MKAVVYDQFQGPLSIREVPDPSPGDRGVVIRVEATGICRSDWLGWQGHDSDINLPHVPGHELAGVIESTGKSVSKWKAGDRVTLPFVCGCGACPQCLSGNHQVCDHQFQPGFTHWGSFAEYVAIDYADVNLVRIPNAVEFTVAASLGCRFVTSFRAVADQGRLSEGEWAAVHGCGGVGLSAIMIAGALGARVAAVDITDEKLEFARSVGADVLINARNVQSVPEAVKGATGGGAHVSIDALGSPITSHNSVSCLRKRGRHIQIGLMTSEDRNCPVPMDRIVSDELEILGSHGIQAYKYDSLLEMIKSGRLQPEKLIGKTVSLEESLTELPEMGNFGGTGVTVVNTF